MSNAHLKVWSSRFIVSAVLLTLASMLCAFNGLCATTAAELRPKAEKALERGVHFFRKEVAVQGTYLWQYSQDLSTREGETKATPTQGWIQPPGTPAVGMAFLSAWEATSNRHFLEAAQETAAGLIRGQLRSGGWHYAVDFDPEARKKIAYRQGGGQRGRNVTTFDDDTTQASLRFLLRLYAALGFRDTNVAESVAYALNALFQAQYPNGSWPQGYEEFPDPALFPVKKASYPSEWPRTWPGSKQYWLRYTLNDNNLATLVDTLFSVMETYTPASAGPERKRLAEKARAAAMKAGDFLILAQMPDPQPGWAQQYNAEMHPDWARKFEPPSITAGESQGALRTLLKLYQRTGDQKYLKPIPTALDYLRKSRLAGGGLARFYELKSNKPLFFTRDYLLTYDDRDVPTHYAFKIKDDTESIARDFESAQKQGTNTMKRVAPTAQPMTESMLKEVAALVASQDERGRWVEEGKLKSKPSEPAGKIIRSATFIRNVELLSRYLKETPVPVPAAVGKF